MSINNIDRSINFLPFIFKINLFPFDMFRPVVLAGGFGTRLWPSSREFLPKQFITLFAGEETLFQQSIRRVRLLFPEDKILIIGNKIHLHIIVDQLKSIDEKRYTLCLESEGRNTFPAALLSCSFFDENDTIFLTPSDHLIEADERNYINFKNDVIKACEYADKNQKTIVFGIKPEFPETGYGYIKKGLELEDEISSVEKFVEKPSFKKASEYFQDGGFYWNSGMFAIPIRAFLEDVKLLENESYLGFLELRQENLSNKEQIIVPSMDIFSKLKKESLDYAIIERSSKINMIKVSFTWSDLGDWKSVYEYSNKKDENGNISSKNVISVNNKNTYIINNGQIKIATAGLENTIIIAENDSILMLNRSNAQDVKEIVGILKKQGDFSCLSHPTFENRPWGNFDALFSSQNTKVKRLIVNPRKKLSLQSHNHRSEHWIVTKGIATVTLDDREIQIKENESIFIPKNAKHRIENKTEKDLVIIEIQVGDYLGEDDIKRYQDDWGRS